QPLATPVRVANRSEQRLRECPLVTGRERRSARRAEPVCYPHSRKPRCRVEARWDRREESWPVDDQLDDMDAVEAHRVEGEVGWDAAVEEASGHGERGARTAIRRPCEAASRRQAQRSLRLLLQIPAEAERQRHAGGDPPVVLAEPRDLPVRE